MAQSAPQEIPPLAPHQQKLAAHEMAPILLDGPSGSMQTRFDNAKAGAAVPKPSDQSEGSPDVDVETWFVRSNSRVASGVEDSEESAGAAAGDDGTPYFLQHSYNSNDISPHDLSAERLSPKNFPWHSECSSAEYRSVIDDLTIENNELKRRLMQYETSHSVGLDKDKLFEVKVYSLPPAKKRELEETLQAFASNVDSYSGYGVPFQEAPFNSPSVVSRPVTRVQSPRSLSNYPPSLEGSRDASSDSRNPSSDNVHSSLDTSNNSRLVDVDSGYASMQNSKNSKNSSRSTRRPSISLGKEHANQLRENKARKVTSFLEDVPQGWLPSNSSSMTETEKRRNVVRRLERLFTGVPQGPRNLRSQPLQQQEVSKSAAKADERMEPQFSFNEGLREAQMLPHHVKISKKSDSVDGSLPKQDSVDKPSVEVADGSDQRPEQRPTRPLDLDPHRAQIPAENFDYIRHLGLSAPDVSDGIPNSAADEEGWIYLNLLIGMAQLHIMHVTLDFVRTAVLEVSEKFEVSPDGQKLRWRGGTRETRFSSASASSSAHRSDSDDPNEHRKKRRKYDMVNFASAQAESHTSGNVGTYAEEPLKNTVRYRPLFNHHQTMSDRMLSSESGYSAASPRAKIAKRQSALHGISPKRPRNHDGPIVFYNSAPFYTDLTGDRRSSLEVASTAHTISKFRYVQSDHRNAIGAPPRSNLRSTSPTPSGSYLPGRPFKDYSIGPDLFRTEETRPKTPELLSGETELEFSPHWAADQRASGPSSLQELPASGIGGSQPSDKFLIKVHTRRIRTHAQVEHVEAKPGRLLHRISTSLASGLDTRSNDGAVSVAYARTQPNVNAVSDGQVVESHIDLPVRSFILSEEYQEMTPSSLPDPYFGFQSSSTDESENPHRSSSSSGSRRQTLTMSRVVQPQTVYRSDLLDAHGIDDGAEVTSGSDDSTDGSIDMLALARLNNPEAIMAIEQEFDDDNLRAMQDRAPGSSDATADDSRAQSGGSGTSSSDYSSSAEVG